MMNKALKIPLICPRKSIYTAIVYNETSTWSIFMSQLCETQHNQKLRIHSARPGIVIGFTNVRSFDCPIIMITTRILFWKPHRRNAIVRTPSMEHHSSVCTFSLPTTLMVYSTVSLMLVHPHTCPSIHLSIPWTPEVEGEGGLAGALDQKKAPSVILHIKQALDGIWFCTFCLMRQWTESYGISGHFMTS